MAGATSLIQLILKKWGDDIAGAAKELEEKVGFPESVANRIAAGELPMDAASVEARRIAQGYGDELYHGSTHDITEFNGQGNPSNDWGQGTYLTDSIYDASTNYAGEGPDLTIRLETTAERIADDLQSSWSHASEFWDHLPGGGGGKLADEIDALAEAGKYDEAAMMAARAITKGGNEGVIYPVRVKQEGLLNVTDEVELPDYNAQAADELGYDYDKYVNDEYDEDVLYEIEERGYELEADDYDSPNAAMFGVANDLGADMRHVESIYEGDTWNDVRNKLGEASVETDEGDYIGAGGILSDVMARTDATGVVDEYAPSRFPTMGAGEHTIIFPGNENQIRSVNAAFDPQYTGSNIMGGLALPVAAGLLASGQSEDADAGFITKGGKTLLEAWHGSPHKFDKFSMDAIGTGEGAQAYGHGLYFADSEDVAKQYRDSLSGAQLSDGKPVLPSWDDPRFMPLQVLNKNNFDVDAARKEVVSRAEQGNWLEQIDAFDEMVANGVRGNLGHLYRTEIDVTPESLLDWDKPLSEQPQAVQDSLQFFEFDSNNPSGKEMYHAITNQKRDYQLDRIQSINREMDKMNAIMKADESGYRQFKTDAGRDAARRYDELMAERALLNKETTAQASQSAATSELDAFGIKGIKYLDGDSRAVGDGTSNYVIFDDSLINIAERGNATVPLLGAAALGSAGLLAAPILMGDKEKPTTPEERGFKSWEEVSRDPTAPLPAPTWGEAMGKAGSNLMYLLGMPMTGLQGLARGGYGLLTGEGLTEAAAQAGNTMDVRWKDGLLDVSGMNPDKGADQAEAFVTEKTGDESLGWLAKMGLLFGGI